MENLVLRKHSQTIIQWNILRIFSKFNKNINTNNTETPLEKKYLIIILYIKGFGNAKTLCIDNSSHFGKYVKIKFNNEQIL